MHQKIALSLSILLSYSLAQALPAMVSDEEDWLHSDAKRCIASHQSRLDHQVVQQAENGSRHAQLLLGTYLLTGTKLPANSAQAYHWLMLAAKQGEPKALYLVGAMLEQGLGVKMNVTDAAAYYQAAIDAGEGAAAVDLARLYAQNSQGFLEANVKEKVEAIVYSQANAGIARAQLAYGLILLQPGENKDQTRARQWLLKAAIAGEKEGYYLLALNYLQEADLSALDDNALTWMTQQANDKQEKYAYLLGLMYHFGYGVSQSDALSSQFIGLSAQSGYDPALQLLVP